MKLNLGHSEFPEQQGGLMICGYEWGGGDDEGEDGIVARIDWSAECTFANRDLRYGPSALKFRYDNKIKKWFELWGRPLNGENPGQFERSIILTNWCDSQNPSMGNIRATLNVPSQIDNFLIHVDHFRPNLILFMGRDLIEALNSPTILPRFEESVGKCVKRTKFIQKPSSGTRFKIGFQAFERCDVVCFPHPSSARGLSYDYIASFKEEMRERFADYDLARMYARQAPGLQPNNRRLI